MAPRWTVLALACGSGGRKSRAPVPSVQGPSVGFGCKSDLYARSSHGDGSPRSKRAGASDRYSDGHANN
eukprot:12721560-Alexandrium_andersonii.AAC.1